MSFRDLCFSASVLALFLAVTINADTQCGDGWTHFQGSCYFLDDTVETWLNAREICQAVGGHLVEIESVEENTFLVNMMKPDHVPYVWIGMEDYVKEGTFVWERYQDIPEYANWNPGEPNDMNHREDCASLLASGHWNDAQCERSNYRFICEKSAVGDGTIG